MKDKFEVISGQLKYREIDFVFLFDGKQLRMIPPKSEMNEILKWFSVSMGDMEYTKRESHVFEESFLEGVCNENGSHYVFLIHAGTMFGYSNYILSINVFGYIQSYYPVENISKISFVGPEINHIHPVNNAIGCIDIEEMSDNGVFTLKIADFDSTTTNKQEFDVDGKSVSVYFGITRGFSTKITESPVSINSNMVFEFDPTSDYDFLVRLWKIAKSFICYLCYRKNVYLRQVDISITLENGKNKKIGNLFVSDDSANEIEKNENSKCIKQRYIDGYEGMILGDIAKNSIYTRHIPNSSKAGRHIDAARFVMITAAFEWEFRRLYPDGIPKSESTLKVESQVEKALKRLIDSSSGDLKRKYKLLLKTAKFSSLENKVIKIGEDFHDIIGIFGDRLYKMNGEQLSYKEMGERIAKQRNNFAHGNLENDFIGSSLLDVIYMEYLVYAIQLKKYGVSDLNIRKSINDLFNLRIAIIK